MSGWTAIRRLAEAQRRDIEGPIDSITRADGIVQSAIQHVGLWSSGTSADDPALAGAQALLDRSSLGIIYNADLPAESVAFNIAHELAHFWLHADSEQSGCRSEDIDAEAATDTIPYGETYVSGYSPAQRRETEANVFAAAFLLPGALLRSALRSGLNPSAIAEAAGLTEGMVLAQLTERILSSNDEADLQESPPESKATQIRLDESQRVAAEAPHGPVLVVAGPGTGKTRTLVSRIVYLLETGAEPESIVALTFSNRAAGEIRERVAEVAPDSARRIWTGTFHSFGLEVLRRFGERIGLPPQPKLLDPLDAIELLERNLSDLNLRELEYLHNPAFPFRDILTAISRAKDEVIGPEDFERRLQALQPPPIDDEDTARASARLREVAHVYRQWQKILQSEGLLDFGDLIMRPVELMRACPDVRVQLADEYRHILVDEYQDINRASALFLKELAGDGAGLWAVGDVRQAIYGFRGAAPSNVTRFLEDYPGSLSLSLNTNYRSQQPIISAFADAAESMDSDPPAWVAQRGLDDCAVVFAEAEDEDAQAAGIAESIRAFESEGITLGNQAILCRTNSQAEKLAEKLEAMSIPVIYLGDLFSRTEVRDMLALLSTAAEPSGQGLVRVGRFPEYAADIGDISNLIADARAKSILFPLALKDTGNRAFERIWDHISPIAYRGSAFAFLSRYLFGEARYLRDISDDPSLQAKQRCLALRQLLLLAREFASRNPNAENPHRAFLDYVRRLISTQEDTRIRAAETNDGGVLDGVRLMTIHASKGLEFPVVFVPNLARDLFPGRGRSGLISEPEGLRTDSRPSESEEEARLFFVALSRARDHLVLSRPRTVGGKSREPSPLLGLVRNVLNSPSTRRLYWNRTRTESAKTDQAAIGAAEETQNHVDVTLAEIEEYMRCPLQYYYSRVLSLPTPEDPTPYRHMQRCLRSVAKWLTSEISSGRQVSEEGIQQKLDELWRERALADHRHSVHYLARARDMAAKLLSQSMAEPASSLAAGREAELPAEFGAGRVRIPVDHITDSGVTGFRLERYDGGRPSKSDLTAPRQALIRFAAKNEEPEGPVQLRIRYLSTGEVREIPEQPRWEPARVAKFERALEGIRDGDFTPNPTREGCSRCPFLFICPS